MVNLVQVDDQQVTEYLRKADARIYILGKEQFNSLINVDADERKLYYQELYQTILDDIDNADKWLSLTHKNIEDCFGLFTLTKFCIIGSDIHHHGMLAPIELQKTSSGWTPHPGGDRSLMIQSMGETMWPLNVIIDVKPYNAKYLPHDLGTFIEVRDVDILKKYIRNWDTGLRFITPYELGQTEDDHTAFMKVVIKHFNKLHHQSGKEDTSTFQGVFHRFECKNSKNLFKQISNCKELILNQIVLNKDSITAGPWTVTQQGDLIWDSTKVWHWSNYL